MLAWSAVSPNHVQSQFQTQLQQFGGQSQSQSLGPRPHYLPYSNWLADTPSASLTQRRAQADLLSGVSVYLHGRMAKKAERSG